MAYTPIVPATLAFDARGVPCAPAYGDVYHSVSGALGQARHVFLAGNGLPARWQGRDFVILETGFGLGLNFLATWQAWREKPGRRLHYVAVEKHPLRHEDLEILYPRWPELAPLAGRLLAQWPLLLPGLHRLDFGDVCLTLAFGDAEVLLPQLILSANAIYLDGFAPRKNPAMWSETVATSLRRLCAPDATLATWSVAKEVFARLSHAGFVLEKRPGFGSKREMLVGHLPGARPVPAFRRRRIAVIGAGIAGASIAYALARRGHEVTVHEAAAAPAQGASGNPIGVFRPLPSADDNRLARLLRAGFLLGRHLYAALSGARFAWCGVLHLARDAAHEEKQRRIAALLPDEFCRFVEREEACALAGWPVERGGWWFSKAGWVNPPSLVRALLEGIELRCNTRIEKLEKLAADEIVLANGIGAVALVPQLAIRGGRGVVSFIPEDATARCQIVATRLGYVTPPLDGLRCAGATMSWVEAETACQTAPQPAEHRENLYRLEMILPGFGAGLDPATLTGRAAVRPMSPDRLPLVGPLSASRGLWLIDGFGARGLVFAPICAELLASQISGEPLPLEADLVASLAPARFMNGRRS